MEQQTIYPISSKPLLQVGLHSFLPIFPILLFLLQLTFLFSGGIPHRPYEDLVIHRLMWVISCAGLMWFVFAIIRTATNRLCIFPDRIEIYTGIGGKTIKQLPLSEISQVTSRHLGSSSAGYLTIETKTGSLIKFGLMSFPIESERLLKTLLPSEAP